MIGKNISIITQDKKMFLTLNHNPPHIIDMILNKYPKYGKEIFNSF